MGWMRGVLWAVVLASGGCGSDEHATREQEEQATESTGESASTESEGRPEWSGRAARFFGAEGAPHPLECTTAEECVGDTIPDLDQPCCQDPHSLQAYSRAYRSWIGSWRSASCEDVTCPPPPAPSRPPECAFDVRCAEGRCENSCP